MKNIKKHMLVASLFLGIGINAQVGIKNNEENPNVPYDFPISSASLDVYATKRGLLIPKHDLKVVNDPTTPVDFTKDKMAGKTVDGTMIFNIGNTYKKGFYVWVENRWHLVIQKGAEPQQLSISIPALTYIIPETPKDQLGTFINPLGSLTKLKNGIKEASITNNSITLPPGKYSYRYSVDAQARGKEPGTYFYKGNYNSYSIKTFLQKTDGTMISDVQRMSKIASADDLAFLFFEGSFIFELDAPTTIQQTFQYDDGSTHHTGIATRSDMVIVITRVSP